MSSNGKGSLRQRSNKKKSVKTKPAEANKKTDEPKDQPTETAWDTIKGHWSFNLYLITMFVVTPYALYLGYYYIFLQRPDLIAKATLGMYQPRPSVAENEPRQVLIVGTMSSGTTQTATDLKSKLGLEIGHEVSDADWNFVRDGTVSWFHGIRYLPLPKDPKQTMSSLTSLCTNFTDSMGFHPKMYRDTGKCSSRQKWSNCWMRECASIVTQEWNCAESSKDEMGRECATPYARVLHQVRHPVRAIESLVTKFCQGGIDGTVHPALVKFSSALFPQHDFSTMSCIEAASVYTVEYNRAIMNAGEGVVHERYHVEDVTPCDIARMAGFLDDNSVVYAPNKKKVTGACDAPDHVANQKMKSTAHRVNEGQLLLVENDFLGGSHGSIRQDGDQKVLRMVKSLTKDLGYSF